MPAEMGKLMCRGALVALLGWVGGCMLPAGMPAHWPAARAISPQDQAAFDEAMGLLAELKYAEAGDRFADVLVRFEAAGDSVRTAETIFWVGFCREKEGRLVESKACYERVLREYPQSPVARRASERLSRLPPGLPWMPPASPFAAPAVRPAPPPGTAEPSPRPAGPPASRPATRAATTTAPAIRASPATDGPRAARATHRLAADGPS